MISSIVSLIISTIVFIVLSIIFNKSDFFKIKNKSIQLSLVISIILTVILSFIPFENAFMSFSSPQKAFSYYNDGEIKTILDGENSTMIIANDNNADQIDILPKTKEKDKWKIGNNFDINTSTKLISKNVIIYIYNYNKTNDYYVTISIMDKNIKEISDNCNSEFHIVDKNKSPIYYFYAAYIKDYNDDYSIFINSKEIKIHESTPMS